MVDAEKGKHQPAFDHQKLAASLTKAAGGDVYRADKLPFESFQFDPDARSIRFDAGKDAWKCNLDTYECSKLDNAAKLALAAGDGDGQPAAQDGRPRGRRDADGEDFGQSPSSWVRSPDGLWEASVKDHNLTIRHPGKTDETRLSSDGTEKLSYGRLSWAPDSRTLVAFRIEPGDDKEVYLIQSSPPGGGRAKLQKRALPSAGRQVHRV